MTEIHPSTSVRWSRWWTLWSFAAIAVAALLSFNGWLDTHLWCATRWLCGDGSYYNWPSYQAAHAGDASPHFYMTATPPLNSQFYNRSAALWQFFKDFGEPWMTLIVLIIIAFVDRKKWIAALAALIGTSLAGGISALIRIIDGRYRPTHTDGANVWSFLRGFHSGTDLSFPSGHATLAFATAAVLSHAFPRARFLFAALAACTAVSRVVMEAHFWSDVLFGSVLGWTVGCFTMIWMDAWHKTHVINEPALQLN